MDKKLAAEKIRKYLEDRIANSLGCKSSQLPHMKIGSMVHLAFLLDGTHETIGGFHTTMGVILQLLGHEIVWEIESREQQSDEKIEVVN